MEESEFIRNIALCIDELQRGRLCETVLPRVSEPDVLAAVCDETLRGIACAVNTLTLPERVADARLVDTHAGRVDGITLVAVLIACYVQHASRTAEKARCALRKLPCDKQNGIFATTDTLAVRDDDADPLQRAAIRALTEEANDDATCELAHVFLNRMAQTDVLKNLDALLTFCEECGFLASDMTGVTRGAAPDDSESFMEENHNDHDDVDPVSEGIILQTIPAPSPAPAVETCPQPVLPQHLQRYVFGPAAPSLVEAPVKDKYEPPVGVETPPKCVDEPAETESSPPPPPPSLPPLPPLPPPPEVAEGPNQGFGGLRPPSETVTPPRRTNVPTDNGAAELPNETIETPVVQALARLDLDSKAPKATKEKTATSVLTTVERGTSMSPERRVVHSNTFYMAAAEPFAAAEFELQPFGGSSSDAVPGVVDDVLTAVDSDFASPRQAPSGGSSRAAAPPSLSALAAASPAASGDEMFSQMYSAFLASKRKSSSTQLSR